MITMVHGGKVKFIIDGQEYGTSKEFEFEIGKEQKFESDPGFNSLLENCLNCVFSDYVGVKLEDDITERMSRDARIVELCFEAFRQLKIIKGWAG